MVKLMSDEIEYIEDEETLLELLKEKLNLPIPEDLFLDDITYHYSNDVLGLSGFHAKQVLDCQEIRISAGQSTGLFLIRFESEHGYSGVLNAVTKGLEKRGLKPSDLRFICTDEYYQPFAIAYYKDLTQEERRSAGLHILVWTQDNTHIHIAPVHEVPPAFVHDKSSAVPEKQEVQTKRKIVRLTKDDLFAKLDDIGTRLSSNWEVHKGITTGRNKAFIIDRAKHQQLIDENPQSSEIIRLKVGKFQEKRWVPDLEHIIWVTSSKYKQWPWTDAPNEVEGEKIFEENFPAIYQHLIGYTDTLKQRRKGTQGRFYWELPLREHYPNFFGPKIIFYDRPPVLAFYDESDAIVVNPHVYSIQTSDLSLLAIVNSHFFEWYADNRYERKSGGRLNKTNLSDFPVAGTDAQKTELSKLVQQILDEPDRTDIHDLEEEINQIVYKLYDLTSDEIKLIEEGTNE